MEKSENSTNATNSNPDTKSFEQILQEKDYKYKGKDELLKLDAACKEYLETNGAIWYLDFKQGLNLHLLTLFNNNIILKNSWMRSSPYGNSEDKIKENIEKQKLENAHKLEYKSSLELEKLREQKLNSFKLGNIYSVLRLHYNMNKEDKITLNVPINLVTKKNFEQMKEQTLALRSKTMDTGNNWQNNQYTKFVNDLVPGYIGYRRGNITGLKYLGNLYLQTASKLSIAYLDEKDAIYFFETNTGILLSKPKENKFYTFGEGHFIQI
jgi:hypothetical protein